MKHASVKNFKGFNIKDMNIGNISNIRKKILNTKQLEINWFNSK